MDWSAGPAVRAGYGPIFLNGPWLCHIFGPAPLNPWTMRVWPAGSTGCPQPLDLRTGPFDLRGPRDGGGPIYLVRVRSGGGLARSAANASLCWRTLRGAGLNKESEAFAEKLFDTLARQRGIQGGSINKIQVDKDADGRITEEEIKEVQYKIINSPLTVWPYFIWKKIDRQPGDALVAWTRGNYKRKKTDTQPWDEVLVAWGGQGRVVGVTIAENNGNGLDLQEFLLHVVISSGA
ncbi:hypothetical protein JHK84_044985 [Glycine max]|nr:hypothetical protein JHK85_045488 [Glycine max]KAG5108078.1 hypothetical protein JHK84_044985 [Glycine max]